MLIEAPPAPSQLLLNQSSMKQLTFLKNKISKAHGGDHSIGKRRSRRVLKLNKPMHVTLRSDFAYSGRCLLRHQNMINKVIRKASLQFRISVYEKAICGNHLHILVRGKSRFEIQNFFRVVAGHIAQSILESNPILSKEKPKRGGALPCKKNTCKHPKNQRKFWDALIYTRVLSGWGKEFRIVKNYIVQNTLEALGIIPYQQRRTRYGNQSGAVPSG